MRPKSVFAWVTGFFCESTRSGRALNTLSRAASTTTDLGPQSVTDKQPAVTMVREMRRRTESFCIAVFLQKANSVAGSDGPRGGGMGREGHGMADPAIVLVDWDVGEGDVSGLRREGDWAGDVLLGNTAGPGVETKRT